MKPFSAALVLAGLVLAGLAGGCTPARPPAQPQLEPLSNADIRELVTEVSAARELAEKRPVRIELLPQDRFAAEVRKLLEPDGQSNPTEQAGFLLGFNFLPRIGKGPPMTSATDVLTEQIVGYYHRKQDRVFIRQAPPSSPEDALLQRGVIAHEVHHALQAQHFELAELEKLPDDDARLAQLALVEGDAQVAMAAYLGSAYGAPIRRTIRRITDVIQDVPLEALARRAPKDHDKLLRALPLMRERLTFPYIEGMTFVADIYRAGGFDLVNRLYAEPPSSTSHILHPESYLAGVKPYELQLPAPPAGHKPIARGRLGELQLRVRLSACVPRGEAADAAAGWAGDNYLVTAGPTGKVALFWRTAWETDEDAAEFESAVRKNANCWHENAIQEPGLALSVESGLSGRRQKAPVPEVALVRGLPNAEAEVALQALVTSAHTRPTPVAMGNYRVPPREPLPRPQRGFVRGLVYRSDWLGIEARLPTGMGAATNREHLELFINRSDVVVAGALALSDRVTTSKYNELAFRAIAQGFADALGGGAVVPISHGASETPLGMGIERTWALAGTPLQMRMLMVPICAGNGSLVFLQAYADPYARQVLDGWLGTFRWITRRAPVCGYLDPQ